MRPRDRDVYVRGSTWWGVIPADGEAIRQSLRLPASAPRAEAVARWLELSRGQRSADAAARTPRLGPTLDAYHAEQARRGRSEATREIDATKAGHFLRLWGGALPLHRITAELVAQYVATRETEASPRTVQRELVVLRGALKLAAHLGRLTTPIARLLPLSYAPEYRPRTRHLSPEEAHRLLAALQPERMGWVAFALATGARRSEVERVTLADIGDRAVRIRGTKTAASDGTVPITSLQAPWLAIARARAAQDGPAFGRWGNVLRGLRHACTAAGLAPVTPNDLRRTLGYWLRDAGVSPDLIGRILRHTNSRMAELVYGRGTTAGLAELLEAQLAVRQNVRETPDGAVQRGHGGRKKQRKQAKK